MSKREPQLMTLKPATSGSLVRDIRALIEQARKYVARSVDTTLAALYWQVGQRIQTEILKGKRVDYGDKIVQTLSAQLLPDYGRGFGKRLEKYEKKPNEDGGLFKSNKPRRIRRGLLSTGTPQSL